MIHTKNLINKRGRLSVVAEFESVVTANLQRATRLRQSILQKAFTGRLTAEIQNQIEKGNNYV